MAINGPRPRSFGARRWECPCKQPPVLLGTLDASGRVNIKARDRYWHIEGKVRTTCPICGAEHVIQSEPGDRAG